VWTLADHNVGDKNKTAKSEDMLTDLADILSNIDAEMHALEEEYQKDLIDHKQGFLYSLSPKFVLL
jgi:ppGpp synthetase/RelA/SpoT-type nucleotidyltranferase